MTTAALRIDDAESHSQCPMSPGSAPEGVKLASGDPRCPAVRETSRFIPYITPLKGQLPTGHELIVPRDNGLGVMFRDETPVDRDRRGALWIRTAPPSAGRPIPLYRHVLPRRTGEAMLDMRCQGCNGDPDRTRQGTLFFVKPDETRRNLNWPDVEYTHHPPVCLPCAREALLECSFAQKAPALRVRNPRPWGIFGICFRPGTDGSLELVREIDRCVYDDLKLLPWMVALQPLAKLSRCTVVDIRAELAAAGL
ncbi:hypothetical protein POF50_001280 [Streptomyces sp. SL13]|uniref:Uncharacterized protein n=1 Tax=Streptantibioticus silvisoli TaxID=2705255 RepID=A0AA90KEG3_9ACTN|nr:hypothetical protein [Streptantibioticus silvisoli]MDI5967995.1 hypothetical protein [Streptantibioticus silvisoli]